MVEWSQWLWLVVTMQSFGKINNHCNLTKSHLLLELTGASIFKASSLPNALNSAKFKASYLKLLCDQIWGETKLNDCPKYGNLQRACVLINPVVVPAFLMDNRLETEKRSCEPKFFHNLDKSSGEELVSDVVMRTIAAPTYFQGYQQVWTLVFLLLIS